MEKGKTGLALGAACGVRSPLRVVEAHCGWRTLSRRRLQQVVAGRAGIQASSSLEQLGCTGFAEGRMRREERRDHPRVDVIGRAVVWVPDKGIAYCRVEDLSIGGALLRGAPDIAIGQRTRISLMFEDAEPLVINVEPVRWTPDEGEGATLAVAFHDLSAHQEDLIQDALLKALEALNGAASGV